MLVSLNSFVKGEEWQIRNIKSDTEQFNLSYLGADLDSDLRRETRNKFMPNFRLFPKLEDSNCIGTSPYNPTVSTGNETKVSKKCYLSCLLS